MKQFLLENSSSYSRDAKGIHGANSYWITLHRNNKHHGEFEVQFNRAIEENCISKLVITLGREG